MVKHPPAMWETDPWVRKIPWRRKWQPISVLLPEKSPGQKSLVGYSSWSCKELNVTGQLTQHFQELFSNQNENEGQEDYHNLQFHNY